MNVADVLSRFFADQPPEWLIDVGVGCGREAFQLRELWPDLKVVGYEPCDELRARSEADGYPGDILPWGAGGYPHEVTLHVAADPRSSSVYPVPHAEQRRVIVRPLDRLLTVERLPIRRAVLWADVEGAELDVLQGAWDMLRLGLIELVNVEVRRQPLAPGACTLAEVDAYLAAFRFARATSYNAHAGADPHEDAVYVRTRREAGWH